MIQLRNLICYVVSQLVDMEATFGKTKLVKLLYLIDVENYRLSGEKLTGLDWVFYHYGPYVAEIDDALRKLDLYIPQEEVTTAAGYRAVVFKPSWDVETAFLEEASSSNKFLVDRILRAWGMEELNPILSYVYFHTEPMKGAQRDDILDFTKIRQISITEIEKPLAKPSANRLEEIRDRFKKLQAERLEHMGKILDPKPRFDGVFWHSLAYMDREELYSVPSGEINLTEESNIRLPAHRAQ